MKGTTEPDRPEGRRPFLLGRATACGTIRFATRRDLETGRDDESPLRRLPQKRLRRGVSFSTAEGSE
jgi:hypothetical protein